MHWPGRVRLYTSKHSLTLSGVNALGLSVAIGNGSSPKARSLLHIEWVWARRTGRAQCALEREAGRLAASPRRKTAARHQSLGLARHSTAGSTRPRSVQQKYCYFPTPHWSPTPKEPLQSELASTFQRSLPLPLTHCCRSVRWRSLAHAVPAILGRESIRGRVTQRSLKQWVCGVKARDAVQVAALVIRGCCAGVHLGSI